MHQAIATGLLKIREFPDDILLVDVRIRVLSVLGLFARALEGPIESGSHHASDRA